MSNEGISFGGKPRFFNNKKEGGNPPPNKDAPAFYPGPSQNGSADTAPKTQQSRSIPDKKPEVVHAPALEKIDKDPKDGDYASFFPEIPTKSVEILTAKGFVNLFPIQQKCFYPIYNREDLIARDLTGSGKTFAFGLPTIEYLRKMRYLGSRRTQAICLAPTRELAIQVTNEIAKLKHYENEFKIVTVYGGVNIDDQIRQLRNGVDVFVGTTGRVLDHIERGNIDFSDLKTIVLDEADQMLKLGFKEDIDQILGKIRAECDMKKLQMCLFSATIPSWVKQVARTYMTKGYKIVDLAQDLKNKTAKEVNHLAIDCPYQNRLSALADVLICYGMGAKTIVFCQTKSDANNLILTDKIKQDIEVMHGDINQNQREVTMKRFKEGKFQVLVATDVAARGLDINNVDLVIQIEPPKDTETYIHRSGRTARAGKCGTCITFYTKKTYDLIVKIEELAGIKLKRVGVPQAEDVIKASSKSILNNLQDVNEDVLHLFADTARELIDQTNGDAEKALQIALAYCSGHYKHKLVSKSLMNGQEGLTTCKLWTTRGRLPQNACYQILRKYWDPRLNDGVRNMKQLADGSGVAFDIRAEHLESFLENYNRLIETGERIDFQCAKCADLPDLEDDYGGGQNWRDNGRDSGYGGGRGRGGHSRGGGGYHDNSGGGWGGGRGGYQRGGRGGGGYYENRDSGYGGRGRGSDDRGGGYGGRNDYRDQQDDGDWGRGQASQQPERESYSAGFSRGGGGGRGGSDFRPKTASYTGQNAKIVQKPRTQNSTGCVVYVSNLLFNVNEQDLMDFFKEKKMDPLRARLLYDNEGNSKGTGFVEMAGPDQAEEAAKNLNNEFFQGRKLVVNIANQNN